VGLAAPALAGSPPDSDFWALINGSRSAGRRGDAQAAALRKALVKLSTGEILSFQQAFDRAMVRAASWDLWGAGYVIHGGMSDDGFVFFRCWLIGAGRETFERAVTDPDSLATLIDEDADEALEQESLLYATSEAWELKTGTAPESEDWMASSASGEPTGQPFTEDANALAARYPNLWARFADAPLQ